MVTANTSLRSRKRSVFTPWVDWLNGPVHEKALWLYMVIVLAHWIEHLLQAYQIYVLHWSRPASLGAVGLFFPWLVSTEILHFGYAVFMLAGLFILRPGFLGMSRVWWNISLGIQIWHFIEHFLLQVQALAGHNLFGSPVPISIVQLWVARPELHLIYNAAVFIPMVVAMLYHKYPPTKERMVYQPVCTCAR